MKKGLLIVCIYLLASSCYGQVKIDTIFTNSRDEVYIIFPDYVDWVHPNSQQYDIWREGNSAAFKAIKDSLPPSKLVLKYGNKFFNSVLAYKETLTEKETQINLTLASQEPKLSPEENLSSVVSENSVNKKDQLIERRLAVIEGNSREEEKNYAIVDEKMIWKVSIMRQDEDYYYLKCGLFNRSKEDYVVETIDFAYIDEDGVDGIRAPDYKTVHNGGYSTKNPLQSGFNDTSVNAKEVVYFLGAVPKINLSSKGELEITIWEKGGKRNLKFSIPGDILKNIEQF